MPEVVTASADPYADTGTLFSPPPISDEPAPADAFSPASPSHPAPPLPPSHVEDATAPGPIGLVAASPALQARLASLRSLGASDPTTLAAAAAAAAAGAAASDGGSNASDDGMEGDEGYYTHMLLHAMTFVNPPAAAPEFGRGSWRALRYACACSGIKRSAAVAERSKFSARQTARRLASALELGVSAVATTGGTGSLLGGAGTSHGPARVAAGGGGSGGAGGGGASVASDGEDGDGDGDDDEAGVHEPCCVLCRIKCGRRERAGAVDADGVVRLSSPAHLASRLQITAQPPDVSVEQFVMVTQGNSLLITVRAAAEVRKGAAAAGGSSKRAAHAIDDSRILSILFNGVRRRLRGYNDTSGYLFTGSVRTLACDILDAVTQYNFAVRDSLKGMYVAARGSGRARA